MADEEKNEETPEETAPAEDAAPAEKAAPAEPEAAEPEAAPTEAEPAAADVESEEERPAGDVNPPPAAVSKAEQRAAAKQAAASQRPVRTPEERHAERDAERKRKAAQRRRRRVKEREKAKTTRTAAPEVAAVHAETTGQPKTRTGRVVSDKAEQTITVRTEIARRHRRYEKIVRSSSTLHAHDPANDAHEGDLVRVVESRPLSKTKRWRLVEVLERAR
jgi:small subunit ribosomal protein S17